MEGIHRLIYTIAILCLVLEPKVNGAELNKLKSILPPKYKEALGSSPIVLKHIWNGRTIRYSRDNDVVTIVLSGTYKQGWLGIGFSKTGSMLGASAMIGWANDDGKTMIKQYLLEGYTPSKVIADKGNLQLTKLSPVSLLNEDTLHMAFQLKLPPKSLKQKVIFAAGVGTPDNKGLLPPHSEKSMIEIDFNKGSVGTFEIQKTSHGVLGFLAWQVAIPLGILFPLYFRHLDPQWFYLHMTFQIIGYVFSFITAVIGLKMASDMHMRVTWHKYFGITACLLSTLQVLALCARPAKDSTIRKMWNYYHHSLGYVATLIGFCNVYLGIKMGEGGVGWIIVFLSLLVFYITLFFTLGRREEDEHVQPPVFNVIMKA